MRGILKDLESKILKDKLSYISSNPTNNTAIREILYEEQKKYCAYTDEYISRTDAKDIDHFNPTLKDTPADNYYNWFLVKHLWNKEKSNKWNNFQPILHPMANDFEERVIYKEGDYIANDFDEEATNLIRLLKLDNAGLAEKRKKYIARKHSEIDSSPEDATSYFSTLIKDDPCHVLYLRAIKEEFGIDIWKML